MERRAFVKNTSLAAAAIAVFGNIKWANGKPIGDSPTTTDILGPYYRPGAPIRTNINPEGFTGVSLHLSGTIFKDDGKTRFQNCLVEIWQCNHKGEYDNLSDDYIYRGATRTGEDGSYHFISTYPTAYMIDSANNKYRPSHIHMRVEGGTGERELITQVYFKGDPHLETDPSSSSPAAINRILGTRTNSKGEIVVDFDVVMNKEFPLDNAVFGMLTGLYDTGNDSRVEFFRKGDLLYTKWNGQILDALYYQGNNSFEDGMGEKVQFELGEGGAVKVSITYTENGVSKTTKGTRILKYSEKA